MSLLDPMDGHEPTDVTKGMSEFFRTDVPRPDRSRSARLDRALAVIAQRVAEPGLNPDDIASAVHVSRRALYQLFEQQGLRPAQAIRDVRLQRCMEAISDPRQQNRRITDIALDFGFSHAATFCRQFTRRYGLSPRSARGAVSGRSSLAPTRPTHSAPSL